MTSIFQIERTAYWLQNDLYNHQQQLESITQVLHLLNNYNLLEYCPYKTVFQSHIGEYNTVASPNYLPFSCSKERSCPVVLPKEPHCKEKLLKWIVSRDFTYAINYLEKKAQNKNEYYRNLELRINLLLLTNDLNKIDSLQYAVHDSDDDSNQVYGNTTNGELLIEEKNSIRRIKLILVISQFLQGNLINAYKLFFKYYHRDRFILIDDTFIGIDVLIEKDEIVLMINIILLFVISFDQYIDITEIDSFGEILAQFTPSEEIIVSVLSGNFKSMLKIWKDKFAPICKLSLLIGPYLDNIQQILRIKIWNFYINISNTITIEYLSQISGIAADIIKDDILQNIMPNRLDLELEKDQNTLLKIKPNLIKNIILKLKKNELKIDELLKLHKNENFAIKNSIQNEIIANEKSESEKRYDKSKLSDNTRNCSKLDSLQSSSNSDMDEINILLSD